MSKPAGPTKAILYARFSPRPRAAECESCEHQLADLREYCEEHGYEVTDERTFRDEAKSGSDDWNKRPGLLAAETAAKRGMLFLVRSFDRLFRDSRKAANFEWDLERRGVELLSITEPAACEKTLEAKLIRTVKQGIDQYIKDKSNARTKAAMLRHQANGRRQSLYAPYGWTIDPSNPAKMRKNYDEIATIALIAQLYCDGSTFRGIARELDRRGIAYPGKTRQGGTTWKHGVIKKILRREGIVE